MADRNTQIGALYFELRRFFVDRQDYDADTVAEALMHAALDVMPSDEAFLMLFERFRKTRQLGVQP